MRPRRLAGLLLLVGLRLGCARGGAGHSDLVERALSPDAETRRAALAELGRAPRPEAVEALLRALDDDDPRVAIRAAEALAAAREPRAVPRLIEMTRELPAASAARVVEAIGRIGGPEAEAYLFVLETGSPEEEVRRMAAKYRAHETPVRAASAGGDG